MQTFTVEVPEKMAGILLAAFRRGADEFHGAIARQGTGQRTARQAELINEWRKRAEFFDNHAEKLKSEMDTGFIK